MSKAMEKAKEKLQAVLNAESDHTCQLTSSLARPSLYYFHADFRSPNKQDWHNTPSIYRLRGNRQGRSYSSTAQRRRKTARWDQRHVEDAQCQDSLL